MTLDELAATLPWGFHDAEVNSLNIDYIRREVAIDLVVYLGDLPDGEAHYRPGTLTLSGLHYCCIEPPSHDCPFLKSGSDGVTIDTGPVEDLVTLATAQLPRKLPEGSFLNWFCVYEWNAFLYIAASHASLRWHELERVPEGGLP